MSTATSKQDVAKQAQDRVQMEKERVKRQGQQVKTSMTPTKAYLLLYNLVSTALWAHLLYITLSFLVTRRPVTDANPTALLSWFTRVVYSSKNASKYYTKVAGPLGAVSNYLAGSYQYKHLGWHTKVTQSLAALEVVHAALGLVRSPVGTTAAQVASRLYTVWGVVEAVPSVSNPPREYRKGSWDNGQLRAAPQAKLTIPTHNSPLFTTMLLAWSLTEVIRYSYYFLSLLSIKLPILDWLRYSTFYALYPLGASSEAFIAYSTLPSLENLPFPDWVRALNPLRFLMGIMGPDVKEALLRQPWGRRIMWNLLRLTAGAKGVVRGRKWEGVDYVRLGLFAIWWPALYVLFNYMIVQRKKVLGKGKRVGGVNKAR